MFLWIIICVIACNTAKIINIEVNRTIDITSQTVREKVAIVFKNDGKTPVNMYTFLLPPEETDYFIEFRNNETEKLHHVENLNVFTVHLDKTVEENNTYKLIAIVSSVNNIKPLIATRRLHKNQIVYYRGNVYYYSRYKTLNLKVQYICKYQVRCIPSYVPHSQFANNVYFFYSNVIPRSIKELNISFVKKDPLFAVTFLDRTLDISHWGRISIEDRVVLRNIGAHLKGPYEPPYQFPRPWLYTHLPASCEGVKYFDELGNNSKSELIYYPDHITLKHQARYPLIFGGWKATYVLQYKVPTYEYLFRRKQVFYLRIRAIDHVVNDGFIEKATIKMLLPEGAVLKTISSPEWFNRSEEVQMTDLCVFGRKTVVLNGKMLLENHITDITVIYEFSDFWLLKTPILLLIYLQVAFMFIIIVNRLK